MHKPLVTIAIPSLNQGQYLDQALQSIFDQDIPVEVVVLDAGSSDNSVEIIKKWESRLLWWRSTADEGQAAAINEGIGKGQAQYVCWLNADDFFLQNGLQKLITALQKSTDCPAVYGWCWTVKQNGHKWFPYLTLPFWPMWFANYCFIAQPATLIRRTAWDAVGGLNAGLQMAMDYDLWWKLYTQQGKLQYVRTFVAATRMHPSTKTSLNREEHYRESMAVVEKYYGKVPIKWKLAWPVMVNFRKFISQLRNKKQA